MGLDEPVLGRLLGVGRRTGDETGGAKGDLGMAAHEFFVCGRLASPGARDELRIG